MDVEIYGNSYIKGLKDGKEYVVNRYEEAVDKLQSELMKIPGTGVSLILIDKYLKGVIK